MSDALACEGNGSSASAVDLSAIEQQKENIAPLAAGRSAKTLHTLFTQDRKTLNDELKAGHDRFNAEIDQVEKDGADDPLDVYHRYVRWTLASYPTGPSHASHLVPLLERATRRFVNEEQYRADIRLLKLWLLYAKYVDCPRDIFRFLEGRQVGSKLASFYEEWAMLEEQANNFPAADSIFTLGIARRAQPYERLKKRREAFQARMLLPRSQIPPEDPASSGASTVRAVLGASSSSIANVGQFRGTAAASAASKKALPNNGAAGFAVFKDDEAPTQPEGQEGWADFGTSASRKKENTRAAVPWAGETLPMQPSGHLSRSQGAAFEIFRDEDVDAPAAKGPPTTNGEGESMLRRSLRAPAEAELLRRNPFRHYAEAVELPEIPDVSSITPSALENRPSRMAASTASVKSSALRPAQPSSSGQSKSAAASGSHQSQKREKVASPLHDIYPDGFPGPEFSIEEIRAARRGIRDLRSGSLKLGAESKEAWYSETREKGSIYRFDTAGQVVLRDPESGVALFGYLARQDEAEQEAKLLQRREQKREAEERSRRAAAAAQTRQAAEAAEARLKEEQRQLRLREEEGKRRAAAEEAERQAEEARLAQEAEERRLRIQRENEQRQRAAEEEAERQRLEEEALERERRRELERQQERDREQAARFAAEEAERQRRHAELQLQREREAEEERLREERERAQAFRPPSPTINTKAALAEVNAMFARTMRFDGDGTQADRERDDSDTEESSSSDEDGFEPDQETPLVPSQAETEDGFWSHSQPSQGIPIASQVSDFGMGPSQASSAGFGFSESEGSTTEESETEQDAYAAVPGQQGQGMSRSSSSSSSASSRGFGFSQSQSHSQLLEQPNRSPEQSLRQTFGSSRAPFVPRKPSAVSAITDENASMARAPAAPVASSSRQAFRPTRKPLGAKPLGVVGGSAMQPAFEVFQEQSVDDKALQPVAPLQIFRDEEGDNQAASSGYEMGRRPAGSGGNRFAPMMDVMTPITERTCEFGTTTGSRAVGARTWTSHATAEASIGDIEGVEDLASSLGSNWEAGKRMELIEEEEESQHRRSQSGSQDRSDASTVVDLSASSSQTVTSSRPAPRDPLTSDLVERFISSSTAPLCSLPGFRDHRSSRARKLDSLQKTAKARRKSGGANTSRSSSAHEDGQPAWTLELGDGDAYSVREKLGEGGYGAVFRVAELSEDPEATVDDEEDGEGGQVQTALKVESPANIWEFYILSTVRSRLDERTRRSIVRPQRLYAYADESHMLLEYCDQGSLLDAVNHASEAGAGPPGAPGQGFEEVLAVFFTIELARTLESLHDADFLHGDFKIDNCLLRLEDPPGGAVRGWSGAYKRDGSGGWASKGVKMIDFGRTIDLRTFERGQEFSPRWTTDKHDCAEVKAGKPWTYQPDYYGLACIAHVLLFGKYLETVETADGTTAIREPLKRYHQAALWTPFFDLLLNPTKVRQDGSLPLTSELAAIREKMEDWLEQNSDRAGKSLKGLLKKLEIHALSAKR